MCQLRTFNLLNHFTCDGPVIYRAERILKSEIEDNYSKLGPTSNFGLSSKRRTKAALSILQGQIDQGTGSSLNHEDRKIYTVTRNAYKSHRVDCERCCGWDHPGIDTADHKSLDTIGHRQVKSRPRGIYCTWAPG